MAALSVAGLWDGWKDIETGEAVSWIIIGTNAKDLTQQIYDRMPAVLNRERFGPLPGGKAGAKLL
jgi:putative SOS response-associated peptidase YedK